MADPKKVRDYTAELGQSIDIVTTPSSQVTGFRQRIYDLMVIPGPSSIRVTFRTANMATAGSVAVYRVVTGDFAKDQQYFAALRLCPSDTRRYDITILSGGINKIEPDTAYWVQVSCRDQLSAEVLPGYISVERKMRTWKRNVDLYVDRIKVYDDADPRGSGELFFQLRVWDALTRVQVQDNATGQYDASSGDTIDYPFTVPFDPLLPWIRKPDIKRIEGANNRFGVFISGRDDDSKDFFNIFPSAGLTLVIAPPSEMPWEEYEEAVSTDTDDSARKFQFIDLPNRIGKSTLSFPIYLSKGKMRFTAYFRVVNEVLAAMQPLRWSMEGSFHDTAYTVIDIEDATTFTGQRAGGRDKRSLVATHITRTPGGGLRLVNSTGAVPLGMVDVEGPIGAAKVVAPPNPAKPSLLLVHDQKQGLRLAELHGSEETPKLVWQKQKVPVRGKVFVQNLPAEPKKKDTKLGKSKLKNPQGGVAGVPTMEAGIFALSDKGAPLRIYADGSSEVIGPVTKASARHLLVQPSKDGWHVVLQDENGMWHATSLSAGTKTKLNTPGWIELPVELGSISKITPLPDGRAIYLGLDEERNLGVWATGVKEVRKFGVWENLLPDLESSPEEKLPTVDEGCCESVIQ